jgi:hypothetical protein
MDKEIKSHLSALLSNARDQEERLGELEVSLEAAIAAMRAANPRFGTEYDAQLSSPDRDGTRDQAQRQIALIDTAIQALKESK